MAEASTVDVSEPPMFFCHKCKTEIRPVIPDYTCPSCNGGFIEELSEDNTDHSDDSSYSGSDRRLSLDRDDDPFSALVFTERRERNPLLAELWNQVLNDRPRNPHLRGNSTVSPVSSSSSSSSTSSSASSSTDGGINLGGTSSTPASSNRNPGAADSNRTAAFPPRAPGRSTITFHHRGGLGSNPPPPEMISLLQHLMGGIANPQALGGPGGIPGFPVQMFNIHGSPRDYAWGEGGLDAIITQLLNNAEGQGAPPAPRDEIQRLENIEISNVHMEQSVDCPVCKEEFEVGQEARKLPCTHFFHPTCVERWLEMHNTCPVCRKSISGEENSPSASSSSPR